MRRAVSMAGGVLACVFAAGGGCAVDHAEEVAVYKRVLEIPAPQASTEFGPISVREAMLLANRQNEELAIEGEDYLQAIIARKRAVANFLPTVSLVPVYARREGSGGTADVAVSGEWNAFNGFSDAARLEQSEAIIARERNDLLAFQESLLLDVAEVYYQVLRSEQSLRVLENSLALQEERLRDVRGRAEVGFARPLDVAQIEAQASATRSSLIDARSDVATGRAVLAYLTAEPVADRPLTDELELPAEVAAPEALLAQAWLARHDLDAARAAVAAARQGVEVAVGQYYPSVTLGGDAFVYRESEPDDVAWTGFVRANLPLFAAGRIRADVREAWSLWRQAVAAEQLLRRSVWRDVEVAYHRWQSTAARLAELETEVRAAEASLRLAEESYQAGRATNLERVEAQDRVLSAQLRRTSALYDLKFFYLDLLRAVGVLREELSGEAGITATEVAAPAGARAVALNPEP